MSYQSEDLARVSLVKKLAQKVRDEYATEAALEAEIKRAKEAEQSGTDKAGTLEKNLTAEIERAKAAEQTIASDLANVDKTLTDSIEAVKNTADKAAEDIEAEVSRATAADATLTADVSTLSASVSTMEKNVETLTTAVQNEVDRAQGVEDTLAQNIETETTRAQQREEQLQADIDAIGTPSTEIKELKTAIESETSRAKLAEQNNADNLTAEIERAKGEEERIENAIPTKLSQIENDGTFGNANVQIVAELPEASEAEGNTFYLHEEENDENYTAYIFDGEAVKEIGHKYNISGTLFTIPAAGWNVDEDMAEYPYYLDFLIDGLTADQIIVVNVLPEYTSIAKAANFAGTETIDGALRLRCKKMPSADIKAQYTIGEYTSISTGTDKTTYVLELEPATSTTLGGVRIGENITNNGGEISVTKSDVVSALGYTPLSSTDGSQKLTEEVARAKAAEAALQTAVDANTTGLAGLKTSVETNTANISTNTTGLAAEIARAKAAEQANADDIENLADTKVEKVDGYGLSSNDYTSAEKTKLAGVEGGANKYTVKAVDLTIPATGWSTDNVDTYSHYIDIAVSGLTADTVVMVNVAPASMAAARAARFANAETLAGKLRLRAASVPTADIAAQYIIL